MRKSKVSPRAGWHHAMNRAVGGAAWLRSREEAIGLLDRIGATCAAFHIDLHAFCVLPRHYHLLVRAETEALRAGLTQLEAGSGFPGSHSPHTVAVTFGRHLMSVSRYIHLNPVDAGLVWCPEHWPFSSFRAYLGDRAAPSWVRTEAVLGRFGTIGARHRHRAYVYAGMDPQTRDRDGRPHWATLFCPGSLAEDLAWRVEPVLTAIPSQSRWPADAEPPLSLGELARRVALTFDVPVGVLRSARVGGPVAALARGAFVHAARTRGGYRLRDVAAFMGYVSPSGAAAAAERFRRERGAAPWPRTALST